MSLVGQDARRDAPDEIAVWSRNAQLSWSQLDDVLNRATNMLLGCDLDADRRIAVVAENSTDTVVAYTAAILAGVSAVPVNPRLRPDELAYILRDSGASIVLAGPESAQTALEATTMVGSGRVIAWRSPDMDGIEPWEVHVAESSGAEPRTDLLPLPFLHYTSGTTGFPKGTLTPAQVHVGGATVAEHVERLRERRVAGAPLARTDRKPQLLASPLHHGLGLASVRALVGGQPLVVLGKFDPELALEAIDAHRVGSTFMVPTHFVRLLALPEETRHRYDVSSLSLIAHAAAPCPVEVKRAMIEWFGPILIEGYGATEMGSATRITSAEWLERPGSVGRALPDLEILIVDDEGNELPAGEVGRIYVRDATGGSVSFHNDAEKSASVHLQPGVYTMGDIGYVDDAGYLYITGRHFDTVISGGVNVYPAEAERILLALAGVADVACIGVPDADLGETLLALVVPDDPDDPPDPAELIVACQSRLSKYKCPRSVEIVSTLGRSETGKLNKTELRRPYWDQIADRS